MSLTLILVFLIDYVSFDGTNTEDGIFDIFKIARSNLSRKRLIPLLAKYNLKISKELDYKCTDGVLFVENIK